jgi:hypothetical protein
VGGTRVETSRIIHSRLNPDILSDLPGPRVKGVSPNCKKLTRVGRVAVLSRRREEQRRFVSQKVTCGRDIRSESLSGGLPNYQVRRVKRRAGGKANFAFSPNPAESFRFDSSTSDRI